VPVVKLDARNVRTLPASGGKRTDYTDVVLPGFVLRVSPTSARTFGVRYYLGNSVKRFTLGDACVMSLADARDQGRRILAQVAMGADPQGEKVEARRRREGALSFGELGQRFLRDNDARLRPNTRRQWRGILNREIVPALGVLAPEKVTRGHVRDFVRKIAQDRPFMANRTFELVRRIFTWAVGEDLVPASPCVGLHKPTAEKPRERTLSSDEIRAVWATLEAENRIGDALRLGFYTGARISEVLGLPFSEIDLSAQLWTIPPERSKNGDAHPIPLPLAAVSLLERLKAAADGEQFVFPGSSPDGGPVRSIQRCMYRITTRSGVAFQFHDIRRTVATGLASLGTPDYVVEAVLGHTPQKLKRTYNRYQPIREMRIWLGRWSSELERIVAGRAARGEVIPLARANA
jgi:integrase